MMLEVEWLLIEKAGKLRALALIKKAIGVLH